VIRLHHCAGARSFRALWALEETGCAYELALMPFPPRALVADYLKLNPLGTVPVLFDGAARMTESAAMAHYIAAKYGAADHVVAPQEAAFADYLNFLHMGEATLTFPQTIVLRYTRLEPPERRAAQAAEDYRKWFLSRLRAAMTMTGEAYACADRFTMADVSMGYALLLGETLGLRDAFPEKACAYLDRLRARPAFQRALTKERQ
jgi:glutathione S-transferase